MHGLGASPHYDIADPASVVRFYLSLTSGEDNMAKQSKTANTTTSENGENTMTKQTRNRIDGQVKIVRGDNEPKRGIHANIRALVAGTGIKLDTLVANASKKLEHPKASDAAFVRGYVVGGLRRGYLKVAA